MDILEVVVKPTWREFLVDLVEREQMDPWQIDLRAVADAYLARVRALQALDLRVPANVILACAILLKMKAERLILEPEPELEQAPPELIQEELPQLVLRPDRPRQRRVTLQELLDAIGEVMRSGKRFTPLHVTPQAIELEAPTEDLNEKMRRVLERANALKDAEGFLLFSALVATAKHELLAKAAQSASAANSANSAAANANGASNAGGASHTCLPPGEAVRLVLEQLIPVLHLVQEHKMLAWQDEVFGEIFLKIISESGEDEEETRKEKELVKQAVEGASAI